MLLARTLSYVSAAKHYRRNVQLKIPRFIFYFILQDMTAINVIDIKSGNLIRKLQYEPERAEDELMVHSSDIVAISLTQKGGFLLACTNVSVQMKNRRLSETQHRTVAYDIDSWKTSGFLKAGWFDKMMFSKVITSVL